MKFFKRLRINLVRLYFCICCYLDLPILKYLRTDTVIWCNMFDVELDLNIDVTQCRCCKQLHTLEHYPARSLAYGRHIKHNL